MMLGIWGISATRERERENMGMTSPAAAAAFMYYLTNNWDHMSFLGLRGCLKDLQE